MDFNGRRQENQRTKTVGSAVSVEERQQIYAALAQGGFPYPAEGVRSILLAYVESTTVRDAVAATLGKQRAKQVIEAGA